MPDNLLRPPTPDVLKRGQELCRRMFEVLKAEGLLPEDEQDAVRYALTLIALSAFYGTIPFSHFIRRVALIWSVWEDQGLSPQDVQHELAYADWLSRWEPNKTDKPL
jgi:hypothetical protein